MYIVYVWPECQRYGRSFGRPNINNTLEVSAIRPIRCNGGIGTFSVRTSAYYLLAVTYYIDSFKLSFLPLCQCVECTFLYVVGRCCCCCWSNIIRGNISIVRTAPRSNWESATKTNRRHLDSNKFEWESDNNQKCTTISTSATINDVSSSLDATEPLKPRRGDGCVGIFWELSGRRTGIVRHATRACIAAAYVLWQLGQLGIIELYDWMSLAPATELALARMHHACERRQRAAAD